MIEFFEPGDSVFVSMPNQGGVYIAEVLGGWAEIRDGNTVYVARVHIYLHNIDVECDGRRLQLYQARK